MAPRQWARRYWPDAAWIEGEGDYAFVAYCRQVTVTLHETRERAEASKMAKDGHGCGGGCYKRHRVFSKQEAAAEARRKRAS